MERSRASDKEAVGSGLTGAALLLPERFLVNLILCAAAIGAAALYFRHILLVISGGMILYRIALPVAKKYEESRDRKRLRRDVLLWLEEMTMALKAGKSLHTATQDLAYSLAACDSCARGPYTDKVAEGWKRCRGLLGLRYPIAYVYRELARILQLSELHSLAAIIGSAVDTGVNLPQVFIQSAGELRGQLESTEILESALASRRLEGCLLTAAPALYTALLRLTSPGYMAPLYTGSGWTAALLVFAMQAAGAWLFFHMLMREYAEFPEMELAGFEEELALHMQAGLSLPEAWQRAAENRMGIDAECGKSLLWPLSRAAKQLTMGVPFGKVMERMSAEQRCTAEMKRLAAFLLQNYQMGSGSLAALLCLEAKESRQRCLLKCQARDAKRETFLLFPMLLLLLSALILTAAPAVLSV